MTKFFRWRVPRWARTVRARLAAVQARTAMDLGSMRSSDLFTRRTTCCGRSGCRPACVGDRGVFRADDLELRGAARGAFFIGLAGSSFAIGAAFVSRWSTPATQGTALGVMAPFTVGALSCAVLMGLGNGAVFKLVPEHFPKEIGTVTGLVGALGGLGGFFRRCCSASSATASGRRVVGLRAVVLTALLLRYANQRVFAPSDAAWRAALNDAA